GNPQIDLQDQGVIDSGCSRHMTGNMSYLIDYKKIDEGYVAFGGNPKKGKITGKCTIKTGNLDFDNVYFVIELKFNLFSVSQIVPRKNNMYSVDLKNIVPKGGLTCLFVKAASDESKLWHKRLDHLGKFDGKADKGFFVEHSLNSKAFRVFNSRTRIVEEKLHIRFSKITHNVVGKKASDNAGQARKVTERVKDYILLPLWTADLPFSQDPKSSHDDGFKPSSDDGKKVDEDPRNESKCKDQENEDNVNRTNNVNTVSSTVNATGTNEDNELPIDQNIHALEYFSTFNFLNDDEDDGTMADMKNLDK
nr:hypothetical protein [Tanacetum cinerariifolium]